MKKLILNIGQTLSNAELKIINGGSGNPCTPGFNDCASGQTCDTSRPAQLHPNYINEPGRCVAIGGGRGGICPEMPGNNCNFQL